MVLILAQGSTSNQDRCLPGTYSNMTGLKLSSECTSCTAGKYCEDSGLTEPNGPCDPGISLVLFHLVKIANVLYFKIQLNLY